MTAVNPIMPTAEDEFDLGNSTTSIDDLLYYDPTKVGTVTTNPGSWSFHDIGINKAPSIQIGDATITEERLLRLERLDAFMTILEEDPEWREKIDTQMAFNKLAGK